MSLSVVLLLYKVVKTAFLGMSKTFIIWDTLFWLGHTFCEGGVSRDTLCEIPSANTDIYVRTMSNQPEEARLSRSMHSGIK